MEEDVAYDEPPPQTINGEQRPSQKDGRAAGRNQPSIISTASNDSEPIAVIGLSLKFPDDASTAEGFWQILADGRNVMTKFPTDRFNIDNFYHPDRNRLDSLYVTGGHFIRDELDRFDAPFFSITPQEAACMDPQQRFILETTYRALENAGQPMAQCHGTQTSVYTGSFTDDYKSVMFHDPELEHKYAGNGISPSMMANRISWFFDLKGPSVNLDTACSSSLTALHLCCQDLRNGTSNMGIVGGSNLIFHPDFMTIMSNMNFLSPDSRCWSFDERANGYARGEGIGVVILKRLSDAVRDGDTVRSIIRATAINQDGRSSGGINVPNGRSQLSLIRSAYDRAGLDMAPTRLFEAHATGTPVGDPIEANAIGEAFADVRTVHDPLFLGCVKPNIGHLEGSSGIASLIKIILVLEHGIIPPISGFDQLNPRIEADRYHMKFPKYSLPWPTKGLRRACINSFGFGGSNAVVVLDDACYGSHSLGLSCHNRTNIHTTASTLVPLSNGHTDSPSRTLTANDDYKTKRQSLVCLSAADETAIKNLVASFKTYLRSREWNEEKLADLSYTLNIRRSTLLWRSYLILGPDGRVESDKASNLVKSNPRPSLAFAFIGQGAQYLGMGLKLLHYPVFKASMGRSDEYLSSLGLHGSIFDILKEAESQAARLNEPVFSQSICTALQVALVDLLQSVQVKPSLVIGHSSGEIAAAYCAGILTHQTALKLAYHKGRLSSELLKKSKEPLSMLAVGGDEQYVRSMLERLSSEVDSLCVEIACFNSPGSFTLSGKSSQLDVLESWLQDDKIFHRRLKVSIAYHSRYMEEVASEYHDMVEQSLSSNDSRQSNIQIVSTVTGSLATTKQVLQPSHWVQNMTKPVLFSQAVRSVLELGGAESKNALPDDLDPISSFLEIGPHRVLQASIQDVLKSSSKSNDVSCFATIIRGGDDVSSLLNAAGQLFAAGHAFDLLGVQGLPSNSRPLITDCPAYPFNHTQSYWAESRISRAYRQRRTPRHELIGVASSNWNPLEAQWRNKVSLSSSPWITDHKLNEDVLFPAAGSLAMAIEAFEQLMQMSDQPFEGVLLRNVSFAQALQLRDSPVECQVTLRPASHDGGHGRYTFSIFSFQADDVNEICSGEIQASNSAFHGGWSSELFDADQHYSQRTLYDKVFPEHFANYGPAFHVLDDISVDSNRGSLRAKVSLQEWNNKSIGEFAQSYTFHPTLLDGLLQCSLLMLISRDIKNSVVIPTRIGKLWLNTDSQAAPIYEFATRAEVSLRGYKGTTAEVSATLLDKPQPFCVIQGYESTFLSLGGSANTNAKGQRLCSQVYWDYDIGLLKSDALQQICHQRAPSPKSQAQRLQINKLLYYYISVAINSDSLALDNTQPWLEKYKKWLTFQNGEMKRNPSLAAEVCKIAQDEAHRHAVINQVSRSSAEGKFLVSVGESLVKLLEGTESILDVMFSGTLANDWYDEILATGPFVEPLQKYVQLLAHKNPNMKILEVGAGTGSCSKLILDALQVHGFLRCSQYDFTDLSPGFFPAAESKLSEHKERVKFGILDIEEDPSIHGFTDNTYDVIIAGGVLHITSDLEAVLRHMRQLLKPGGHLIVFEVANPKTVRSAFATGLLDQWWLGPRSLGGLSPLLHPSEWTQELTKAGFNYTGLEFSDGGTEETHETSVLIYEKPHEDDASNAPLPVSSIVNIMIDVNSASQRSLARSLASTLANDSISSKIQDFDSIKYCSPSICEENWISLIEVGQPILLDPSEKRFAILQRLFRTVTNMLWVTERPPKEHERTTVNLIDGLSRSMRNEYPNLKIVTLEVNGNTPSKSKCQQIIKVLEECARLSNFDTEMEYRMRDDKFEICRIAPSVSLDRIVDERQQQTKAISTTIGDIGNLQLRVESPGIIASCKYSEVILGDSELADDEVLVTTRAFALTERDYLIASGQLNETDLGLQGGGIIERAGSSSQFSIGDPVWFCAPGSFQTKVKIKSRNVVQAPLRESLIESISLIVAGMTAVRAVVDIARLEEAETILIDNASSIAGQMCIQLAQNIGAKILATVSTAAQRDSLAYEYGLEKPSIFVTDPENGQPVVVTTNESQMLDIIIGTNQKSMDNYLEMLSPSGCFIDIASPHDKRVSKSFDRKQGSNMLIANVDIAQLWKDRPKSASRLLQRVAAYVEKGTLHLPKHCNIFKPGDEEEALREFERNGHNGSSIIELSDSDQITATVTCKPSYTLSDTATYVIVGGLGGLGRRITEWAVGKGARNLLILSRSGAKSEQAQELCQKLSAKGVRVLAPACDISCEDKLESALAECRESLPPVRGCIQAGMALKDAMFEKQTLEDWRISLGAKVTGSINLAKHLPPNLDFFVFISSISGIHGAGTQSNYAAGNAFQDAYAKELIATGRQPRASVIDLGVMVSDGIIAETAGLLDKVRRLGQFLEVTTHDFLALLDYHCDHTRPPLTEETCQSIIGLKLPSQMAADGVDLPDFMRRPTFAPFHAVSTPQSSKGQGEGESQGVDLKMALRGAASDEEAGQLVSSWLLARLARLLGLVQDDADVSRPLNSYGLDSLLAIELRNWFDAEAGAQVSVFELLEERPIRDVALLAAERSRFRAK